MAHKRSVLAGLAGTLLLGSGVVALVTDQVVSEDNQLRSPELATFDLQVGRTPNGEADPDLCGEYSDTTALPMRFGSETTGTLPVEGVLNQSDNFCLRNNGNAPMRVRVHTENVVSFDLGCGPTEAQVDPTCDVPGSPGELLDVFRGVPGFYTRVVSDGEVPLLQQPGLPSEPAALTILEPGREMALYFQFSWTDIFDGHQISQTDMVQFDVVFSAVDP